VYLKLRDRASYEFALASAAVVIAVKDGTVTYVRVALGGVGPSRGVRLTPSRSRRQARRSRRLSQGGGSDHARRQTAEREWLQVELAKDVSPTH